MQDTIGRKKGEPESPESRRRRYLRNREYELKRSQDRYERGSRIIEEHKNVPCADCGVEHPTAVMQFDHVRGKKLFTISQARRKSEDVLLAEIAKCDVVCANCHAYRTHGLRNPLKVLDVSRGH